MPIVKSPSGADTDLPTVYFVDDEAPPPSAWGSDEHRNRAAERVVEGTRDALGDAVELARTCAARFSAGLDELAGGVRAPQEITLELSIGLDSQVGAVLAKASASAQFKLVLTWQPEASDRA
jgi:hypothetical protein